MTFEIGWGPGYRGYFARTGTVLLLLLCGGDKTTQQKDIEHAKAYFQDYKNRAEKSRPPSVPYEPWLIERLKNPEAAASYLEAAIEDGDQAGLMLALRHVAQAQGGVSAVARRAKLTREATYSTRRPLRPRLPSRKKL